MLPETVPKIIIVEKNNLEKILEYIKTLSCQSRLIILLLLSTGVRTTEIINITKDNIDLENNQIYLERTKNRKPRFIFIPNLEVKNLIIEQMSKSKKNNFLLCSSRDGSQLTANAVREILKKIKRKLCIKDLSPHKLRHTYGTNLVELGADLESARLLLGHSSYEMTKRYVHLSTKHIKNVNNQFNVLKMTETH
ncbi:MAG: site-specific integrase [Anaeroplasmataceae bacterium]|nr:site-specific integrase [Anaeroplasmataceae bacterium]